ncbi:Fic family protein [Candidatus Berkiella aquae]|uniref:Fic family protein n=1 Tax=Candidatus Berkiella aquae TaxID=295108 RepID=A0A0Q9YMH8_9GAMM|nr:Fic family protein [Candidatus Berkiella aquae]MCS5710353.1 Fic family protein [Candidatus Berkiella aquae]
MAQLYFAFDSNEAKRLSRLYTQSKLRRIYRAIYTDDLNTPIENIVKSNWMQLVQHIVPKGILSFRTAIDLKPIPYKENQNIAFITSSYVKTISLPGLIIKVSKGDNTSYIEQILPNLARSSVVRSLLENLSSTRSDYSNVKTIGEEGVENFLAKELRIRKETALNQIRKEAFIIANHLGFQIEYKKLNQIISALLSTHPEADFLKTPYAKAVAKKEPYDARRLKLFENLYLYIKKCTFRERAYQFNLSSLRNLSFFESYFSNYIEGTKFIIDEAEDIVFSGTTINHRHADSHDVLANYQLTNDPSEMILTPKNTNEFLALLKERHAYLMRGRPEKNPGEFKTGANKAGNTLFVEPEDVIGTLCHAFEFYQLLEEGLPKALFMQFIISEVHPFVDGNGRLCRIMMNAELFKAGLFKIIIPTVHRDNYLNGLRQASRDQYFYTYCKVIDQAQAYTESINWMEYDTARNKIESDHAEKSPEEGLPIFNRALRNLELSDLPKA